MTGSLSVITNERGGVIDDTLAPRLDDKNGCNSSSVEEVFLKMSLVGQQATVKEYWCLGVSGGLLSVFCLFVSCLGIFLQCFYCLFM